MKPFFALPVLFALAILWSYAAPPFAQAHPSDVAREKSEAAAELEQLHALAKQGDPAAQFQLAEYYSAGFPLEQDPEKALDLYTRSAAQGDADAQFRLGELYEQGEVVERDLGKAVEAYREAAEQGHADAQYALAHIYHLGSGVEQDMAAAMVWYRKAARQGNVSSQLALGDQYRIGLVVPRDLERSTKWYRRAAEQGNIFAQYELGNAYRYGSGVAPDPEQAVMWYRRSAEAGNPSAQLALVELEAADKMVGEASVADSVGPVPQSPNGAKTPDGSEAPDVANWRLAADGPDANPDSLESALAEVAEEKASAELPPSETSWLEAPPDSGAAAPDPQLAMATAAPVADAPTVSEMLKRARYQVATLALTTPSGDNAYETYQRVLLIEPDNATALDGIEEIGLKYVELADRAATKGDLENSRKYAAKASVLAPEHPVVQSFSVPNEADSPASEQAQSTEDREIANQVAKQQVAKVAAAREQVAELEAAPNPPGPRRTKTGGIQYAAATPATDSLKDLIENVDDIVLKPYDYQGRQVAVAGTVVQLFWNYWLVADSGQNNMVIDVDGLSEADQAKLEAAFDQAGLFEPVRAHMRGTVERQSFATYQFAATELALVDLYVTRDEATGRSPAGGIEGVQPAALTTGSDEVLGRTDFDSRSMRSGGRDGADSGGRNGGRGSGGGGSAGGGDGGSGDGGSGGGSGDGGSGGSGDGGSGGGGAGDGGSGGSADGGSGGSGSSADGGSGGDTSASGGDRDGGGGRGRGRGNGGRKG